MLECACASRTWFGPVHGAAESDPWCKWSPGALPDYLKELYLNGQSSLSCNARLCLSERL